MRRRNESCEQRQSRRGYRFIGVVDGARTGERTPARVDVKVPLDPEAHVSAGVAAPEIASSSGLRSFVGRPLLGLTAGALIFLVLAASWWVAAPEQRSIAVLSFSDLSPQGDQEYLADGLAEELMTAFASVGLRVAARTSSFSFKGKNTPVHEIARQLDVHYVLEGSVRKSGSQLRIATKLIDDVWR